MLRREDAPEPDADAREVDRRRPLDSLGSALELFAAIAAAALDGSVGLVWLAEPDEQLAAVRVGSECFDRTADAAPARALCHAVRARGEPVLVDDLRGPAPALAGPSDLATDWIAFAGAPLRGDDGAAIGSIAVIDRRRRAFDDRNRIVLAELAAAVSADVALRAHARAQQERIRGLMHDLRSPLSVVHMGAVALLSHEARPAWPRVQRLIQTIARNAEHMRALLSPDVADARRETVDVGALLREVSQDLPHGASVRVVCTAEPGRAFVDGDRHGLRRCFENVLSNAIRFARTQIRVELALEGPRVRIAFEDDGPGMGSVFDYDAVWSERCTRHDDSGRSGSGLGLSITRRIVEAHGGDVFGRPARLGGACFGLVLPVSERATEP